MVKRLPFVDKRLNWRDPNMPVLRMAKARLSNGQYADEFTMQEVEPKHVQEYHDWKYRAGLLDAFPSYKDDPSYFWSKKK